MGTLLLVHAHPDDEAISTGGAIGLTDKQIRAVDTLVTAWRGQGGVAVGSALRNQRLVAGRSGGVLTLHREPV